MNRFLLPLCAMVLPVALCFAAGVQRSPQKQSPSIGGTRSRSGVPARSVDDASVVMRCYCLKCHSTAVHAGELDLERLGKSGSTQQNSSAWVRVTEMLDNGEMPPKSAPQPSREQRALLSRWVKDRLHAAALASAGDAGPVILRRLNNAQYTYTIRDLTGVDLNPAREFPPDSAAGEGFTNTGGSLVMSPALLTKYFDAGKEIAKHAELLPDGFRFSAATTRSDWKNDILARIRSLYRLYSDSNGASQVNLQGIVFDTNDGGRLPIERYLKATLVEREALKSGAKTITAVAREQGLNAKYLGILWAALTGKEPSLLLDSLRGQWQAAQPADAPTLAATVGRWQKALWKFSSVGHIGREGGPKAWQEPLTPIVSRQDVRLKLPTVRDQKEVTLYLTARGVGEAQNSAMAVWQQPRLVLPGRPDLLLRDVRSFTREMTARRARIFAATSHALAAAEEVLRATETLDVAALAKKHTIDVDSLIAWLETLGVGSSAPIRLDHLNDKQTNGSGYAFVNGWATGGLPAMVANSSNQLVHIPGNLKPHGVCVHPTPTLAVAAGWQSPLAGVVRLEGTVTHAHPACGNGVTWALELRRGTTRRRLAAGVAQGDAPVRIPAVENLTVQPGDLVSIVVGPRNADHSCDLTDLELVIKSAGVEGREWSLTRDVSDDVLAGNPHADRFGNKAVWHFYSEPDKGVDAGSVAPAGSLLARWQTTDNATEKQRLAVALQALLIDGPPAGTADTHPDVALYRKLASLGGPLFAHTGSGSVPPPSGQLEMAYGLDPGIFGIEPDSSGSDRIDNASLCVSAPSVLQVRLPADLAAGAEFVATGMLYSKSGVGQSAQMQALTTSPSLSMPGRLDPEVPILANEGRATRAPLEKAFDDFRQLFPVALCYTKIVPVDEVVTLTLLYREDEPLRRLMLSADETRRLDRMWEELHFVSQDALTLVSAYEQIAEFATQDAPAMVIALKPMRKPIMERAAAFRQALVDAEPRQVKALVDFAARAYRRPLTVAEAAELRGLYKRLRTEEIPHEEAFRLTLARIFVAPAFLYRLEAAPVGIAAAPVSDWELANRLSYFLWSSQPDKALRAAAASGTLHRPDVLAAQTRRMLADPRVRRMATEFACQWLHIYDFDTLDEKSEKYFPEFADLRGDMYEESIRFFTDIFQQDASVLSIYDSDHTFVNERLAKFYGIKGVTGPNWRRVDGIRKQGRGGILGLSTTLAKQSGASRTSPILRGAWVSEVLLGEKLPRPPKDVPRLPEDETATDGMTVRQLVARHTRDPKCAGCHRKIDPFGFSLEGFDAVGRRRTTDLANRAVDTRTKLPSGRKVDGLAGLRDYLLRERRSAVIRQFCRKLLGYALGRSTQLSDEPLLAEIEDKLAKRQYRFSAAVDMIVQSRQFREIRGRAVAHN